MTSTTHRDDRGPWATEVVDVVRAASGGMLFGIPLLFTMEVWWVGSSTEPIRLFAVLLLTYAILVVLNRTSGFRTTADVRLRDALADSVEALAIALMSVAGLLVVLREITTATPLGEAIGKVVYEAAPFAIGIGLAAHFLRRGRAAGDGEDEGERDSDSGQGLDATLADVGATLIGALFVAFNIAPTDEVPMIAAAMSPGWLIALMAVSLAVSYAIVFEAGFSDEKRRREQPGVLQHPVTETAVAYLLSLVAAALMLWFFRRFDSGDPFDVRLGYVLVLGLPAAVGGAAGRLAT